MIETWCSCGQPLTAQESDVHQPAQCPKCAAAVRFISAEDLPPGAGAADFDICLAVESAPAGGAAMGLQMFLGGVPEIEVGKLPDKHISLPGKMVSRFHAKLSRLDFGPSRWKLVDNKSTNGLFVNGQRVEEHELQNGDVVKIGEYQFRFGSS